MNLRYFLESRVNAAYTLTHTDTDNYFDYTRHEINDAQKATSQAYKWIDNTYPGHSKFIKDVKSEINGQTAHAHVANSQHNFDFVPGERAEIVTSYFDFEDYAQVKVDLWLCAKVALHAIDLILAVQRTVGGFLPSRDIRCLVDLMADNDAALEELQASAGKCFL